MRRLRKDRPDVHQRVLAGEMSANAAMVEAGFRKRRERKKPSALDRAAKAVAQLTPDEWDQLQFCENQRRYGAVPRQPWSVVRFSQ